jgi:hypothetical protein
MSPYLLREARALARRAGLWVRQTAVGGDGKRAEIGAGLARVGSSHKPREHLRQHRDWKKISWPASDPALSIG